jgi:hypothetical protein
MNQWARGLKLLGCADSDLRKLKLTGTAVSRNIETHARVRGGSPLEAGDLQSRGLPFSFLGLRKSVTHHSLVALPALLSVDSMLLPICVPSSLTDGHLMFPDAMRLGVLGLSVAAALGASKPQHTLGATRA